MFIFVIPFIFYIDHNKNLLVMTLDIRYKGDQLYADLNTVVVQHKIINFKESRSRCFSSNCDSVLSCKHEWISEHVWLCQPLQNSYYPNRKLEICNTQRMLFMFWIYRKKNHYLSNQNISRESYHTADIQNLSKKTLSAIICRLSSWSIIHQHIPSL